MTSADFESEFVRYLADQLRRWAPIEIRRMFGGYGIFRGGTMFGLINNDMLYLRSDEATRPAFAAAGMGPFRYRRRGRLVALGYHQAPPEAVEDGELLGEWADRAFLAAMRRAARPPTRARKSSGRSSRSSAKTRAKRGAR